MHNMKVIYALLVSGTAAQSVTSATVPPWQTGIITEDGTCGTGSPDGWPPQRQLYVLRFQNSATFGNMNLHLP